MYKNVPVDEGPLGVHQIELMVQSGPGLGDGGGVGEHTDRALYLESQEHQDIIFLEIKATNNGQKSKSMNSTSEVTLARSPPGMTVGGW